MCNSVNRGGESDVAVADIVKARMAEAGVSQVWLSEQADMDRSTLNRRLQGRSAFRVDELEAIAAALRCSVVDLLPAGEAA